MKKITNNYLPLIWFMIVFNEEGGGCREDRFGVSARYCKRLIIYNEQMVQGYHKDYRGYGREPPT